MMHAAFFMQSGALLSLSCVVEKKNDRSLFFNS